MKRAVVYYTYDGSCAVTAHVIADKTGDDLIELEEAKPRKKTNFAFMSAAFCALIHTKSKLKPDVLKKIEDYDELVIITPVWASKSTPAINRLLAQKLTGKKIWAVTVQADPECQDSDKILESIKQRIYESGGNYRDGYSIVGAAPRRTASPDDITKQLSSLISQL